MKRNVKRIVKRSAAAVLTGILVSTGAWSASAYARNGGILTDRAEHSDLTWEEYEYSRMDEADFDAVIEGLEDIIDNTRKADEVDAIITAAEDWANEMSRNSSIAYIHSDLVADDEYWDDEVLYYDEMSTSVYDKIQTMYQQIALSANSDVMHARVTEDEWQDILDYEILTDEQKELSKQETELSLKYDTLYNKTYTTTINGKSYDEDSIEDAYSNGTITFSEYLGGLGDILTQRNTELGELYLELVDIRTQLARSMGYENYAEYAYDKIYDRDFTPEELAAYRDDVKNYMVPLAHDLQELMYDEDHYSQLQDFFAEPISEQECLDRLRAHLGDISDDLLVSLDYMVDHHLYDLSVDPLKSPGGYTISICGYNAPYMFNCADGTYSDLQTLVHEFGHYNQMYYMTADSWYYDKGDLDLAEIHSQGLEMLYLEYGEDLYGEYADIAELYGLFNMVYACVEGVKEDAFQYAVYSDPDDLTVEKLNELYSEYCNEYGDADYYNTYYLGMYGNTPDGQIFEWVDIPHTFQSPMYYISYSVSVAAVFELYDEILNDRDNGISIYLKLVDEEYQDSFQNTVEDAGLNNPIANPRFDVYAADLMYSAGLSEDRGETVTDGGEGEDDEHNGTGKEGDDEGDDKEDDKEDDKDDDDEDDDKPRHRRDSGKEEDDDKESEGMSEVIMYAVIGAAAVLLILIIVIIIVAVRSSKKRKAQMQYVPQNVTYVPQNGPAMPNGAQMPMPNGTVMPNGAGMPMPNGPAMPNGAQMPMPNGAGMPMPNGPAMPNGAGMPMPNGPAMPKAEMPDGAASQDPAGQGDASEQKTDVSGDPAKDSTDPGDQKNEENS